MKKTPWFAGNVKPVRKGLYEIRGAFAPWSYFDGRNWNGAWSSPEGAYEEKAWFQATGNSGSAQSMTHWRGLARKPE